MILPIDAAAANPIPPRAYRVDFPGWPKPQRNPDFKGRGELTVVDGGRAFTFSGVGTHVPFARVRREKTFAAEDIWNVQIRDRSIGFSTGRRGTARRKARFVFRCDSAAVAQEVVSFLPKEIEPEFAEAAQFRTQLRATYNPWAAATNYLIAACVLVYLILAGLGGGWISADSLVVQARYGADNAAQTGHGEWWRLLSAMFIHYGLLHLALNMWALFQVGTVLERLQGRLRFVVTYFGCGLIANLTSLCWHGDTLWSAGASGAIFGVIGALIGFMLREKQALPKQVYQPLLKSMLTFTVYNLFFGAVVAKIDNSDHIGGLLAGIALGWLMAPPAAGPASAVGRRRLWAGVLAIVVAVVVGVSLVPKYDYLPLEENDFYAVCRADGSGEGQLIQEENAAWKEFKPGADPTAIADYISRRGLPFYAKWSQDLSALRLEPGRRTARKRGLLVRLLELRSRYLRQALQLVNQQGNRDLSSLTPLENEIQQANEAFAAAAK